MSYSTKIVFASHQISANVAKNLKEPNSLLTTACKQQPANNSLLTHRHRLSCLFESDIKMKCAIITSQLKWQKRSFNAFGAGCECPDSVHNTPEYRVAKWCTIWPQIPVVLFLALNRKIVADYDLTSM